MTHDAIVVSWGARQLPACLDSILQLPAHIRVLVVRGHTEWELRGALHDALADVPLHTPVMIAPDDLYVPAQAVESILTNQTLQSDRAWCGWSNVDLTSGVTNVMLDTPTKEEPTSASDYNLMAFDDVATRRDPFQVGFNGFTLLTMPAEWWLDPETCIDPCGGAPGFASDWRMSLRLHRAGIQLWCDPLAFAPHFKTDYTRADTQDAWKRIDLATKSVEWR